MLETYNQLLELKKLLKTTDEFMCIVADENYLEMARNAIQRSIKALDPYEICLQNIYEKRNGFSMLDHTDAGYQKFRLEWLDRLIEENRG